MPVVRHGRRRSSRRSGRRAPHRPASTVCVEVEAFIPVHDAPRAGRRLVEIGQLRRRPSGAAVRPAIACAHVHGLPDVPAVRGRCGLELTVADGVVEKIAATPTTSSATGFICPKGAALQAAARGSRPPAHAAACAAPTGVRRGATWDEAFAEIDAPPAGDRRRARPRRGRVYLGNPTAHNLGRCSTGGVLLKALGTQNIYSASTVDQFPKQLACGADVRHAASASPVPDVDRTDHLLILGANPLASNGSLLTAPDLRGRLRAIRGARRQGRRRRPAAHAHGRARPTSTTSSGPAPTRCCCSRSSHVLFAEGLVDPGRAGRARRGRRRGARRSRAPFAPERVAAACRHRGRRRSAASRASSPPRRRPAVYGRIGTTTQEFGTLASWLVDVLNVLTGNLDRPGGAMFPKPAAGRANTQRRAGPRARRRSSAAGRAACAGCPRCSASCRSPASPRRSRRPGEGQIRALITIAGNPALSARRTAAASRGARRRSTSWSASTSTSTRRRATPT